jgi:hypothetical protein
VSASEIAAFEYCARAYWLERVQSTERDEESGTRLAAGVAHHTTHGRTVVVQRWLVRLALALLALAAGLVWMGSRG